MPVYAIRGVQVPFPYEAYECQLVFMEKVIQSLQERRNALLESPTGTGKTLCLLCATLAWRQYTIQQMLDSSSSSPELEEAQVKIHPRKSGAGAGAGGFEPELSREELVHRVAPKVIYASRTHSQITQVVRELKHTGFQVRTTVLGSRSQLCIHPRVSKVASGIQSQSCRQLVSAHRCKFHDKVADAKHESTFRDRICDIEELATLGRDHNVCPYYLSKELQATAEVILLPYNYLIDPVSRRSLNVDLSGSIVIFDEAHNLVRTLDHLDLSHGSETHTSVVDQEGICADSASFDITGTDLGSCISETQRCIDLFSMPTTVPPDIDVEQLIQLKDMLLRLEQELAALPLKDGELTKPGSFIYELFAQVSLTHESYAVICEVMDVAVQMLLEVQQGAQIQTTCNLQLLRDAIFQVFEGGKPGKSGSGGGSTSPRTRASGSRPTSPVPAPLSPVPPLSPTSSSRTASAMTNTDYSKFYRVHIHDDDSENGKYNNSKKRGGFNKTVSSGRTLSYWCFNPGVAMEVLNKCGIRNIILTSGTLSPLDSFAYELQTPFPIRLENPHVIAASQVWVGVASKGPSGHPLSSAYQHRNNDQYRLELGNAIVNFARIVPKGLLVFFPSYSVMDQCLTAWKRSGTSMSVWERILRHKMPVIEPRESAQLNSAMEDFYQKVNDPSYTGAVFFAVCRGKVSEGLDFSDNNGRAVIITGMPFPSMVDPKVKLKKQYLDDAVRESRVAAAASSSTSSDHGTAASSGGMVALKGNDWYSQQASRVVNQAIGRVIRHRFDYGAIILCDERFAHAGNRDQLSAWLRPHMKVFPKFGDVALSLTRFFRNQQAVDSLSEPAASATTTTTAITSSSFLQSRSSDPVARSVSSSSTGKSNAATTAPSLYAPRKKVLGTRLRPIGSGSSSLLSSLNKMPSSKPAQPSPYDFAVHGIQRPKSTTASTVVSFEDDHHHHSNQSETLLSDDGDAVDQPQRSSLLLPHREAPATTPPPSGRTDFASVVRSIDLGDRTHDDPDANASSSRAASSSSSLPVVSSKPSSLNGCGSVQQPQLSSPSVLNKQESAKAYINTIKKTLPPGEYRDFQAMLRNFKLGNTTLPQLMEDLRRLLGTTLERRELLRDFVQFIPKKHYEQFQTLVAEICATPPPQPPQSSSSTSATTTAATTIPDPSPPSTPTRSPPTPLARANSGTSTPLLGTKKKYDLISGRELPTSSKRPCLGGSTSSLAVIPALDSPQPSTTPFAPVSPLVLPLNRTPTASAPVPLSDSTPTRLASPTLSRSVDSSSSLVANVSTDPAAPPLAAPPPQPLDGAADQEGGNAVLCCICRERAAKPFLAKCGHISCFECWSRWLEQKLECPVCREKVRLKQLRKMFLT